MNIARKLPVGQDLPGVIPPLDADSDRLLYLVMDELHRRKLPTIIEHAEKLDYVYWSESRGEWVPTFCPDKVYEFMRGIR
ncbi:hypothetical protein KYK29_03175 [Shinella daejeonensis]|uniref:hypothetical protein n=1 Tax=Shinella daejeonensis TaxID=659017 RepID=UPI0020C7E15E|nr:hypothetical protein [Shinella daejeonensis]MCP8893917.1 hypothetical protein [Shinella daejeonensis]